MSNNSQNILFAVDGQTLMRTDTNEVVSNCKDFYICVFEVPENWQTAAVNEDAVITATFDNGRAVYSQILDDSYKCIMPAEVLRLNDNAKLSVGLFVSINNVLITTTPCEIRIAKGSPSYGVLSIITPTLFEQILQKMNDVVMDFVSDHIDYLKGPKGDKGETGPQGIPGAQGPKGEDGTSYDDTELREDIADIWKVQGELGSKNLIPYPYDDMSKTTAGITWTVNNDGSVKANGTSSSYSYIDLHIRIYPKAPRFIPEARKYICSLENGNANGVVLAVRIQNTTDGTIIRETIITNAPKEMTFTSEEVEAIKSETYAVTIRLYVNANKTVDNVIVYPMIRLASDSDNTWQPYAKSNLELTRQQYTFVGVCESAKNAQNKEATVDNGFKLEKGVRVAIKYSQSNTFNATVSTPVTLNVNNTGAKNIYYNNSATPTGANTTAFGYANRYVYYIYDGNYWVFDGTSYDNGTNYSTMSVDELTTGTASSNRVLRADYLHQAITEMIDERVAAILAERNL